MGLQPNPNNPHEFGECMEDWHDYKWRKKQEEIWISKENYSFQIFCLN